MANESQEEILNAGDVGGDAEEGDPNVKSGLEYPDQDGEDPIADQEDLQEQLYHLYLKCAGEDRYARLVEVKDVKQAEFYWGGRQYVWWSNQDKKWNLPNQAQAVNYGDTDIDEMPKFEFVTNIYQSRGLGVIGAIASAPPRYRFFPTDPTDEDDIETAEGRSKEARQILRWNPIQTMMQDEVYHGYTGGFVCWHTRYVADGAKYGTDSLALLGIDEEAGEETIACPECGWTAPADQAEPPVPCPICGNLLTIDDISEEAGIPVPTDQGTVDKPKGRVIISIFGALNCKRPQHVQNQSQYHYFAIEDEVHYSTLRAAFKSKASKIKPGDSFGAEDVYERNARLSVAENTRLQSQSGNNQASLCTYARVWFRPSAFFMLDIEEGKDKGNDGDDDGQSFTDRLLQAFPHGCRVEFSGETYLTSRAESMDDCIETCHAMPGRGQHRNGTGTSLLSVQDRVNTFSNIEAETYNYGIPITYRAADTFASDADEDQTAVPGIEVEVQLKDGQDLRSRILQVRSDNVSSGMQQHSAQLMGPVADELVGTYPAVTGAASDQTPDTLGQHAMQRDSAMGRQGVFYTRLKQAHANVITQACKILEENIQGEVKVPILGPSGDFESEVVDTLAIEGDSDAYPEGDETFPELINQQRATMKEIMDTPYGAELVKDPENVELFLRLTGIPDLKAPGIDSIRKQHKEIAELTKIPEGDEILSGIAPMVEVDPLNDVHEVEQAVCQAWLNSQKGQALKRTNPLGWQAVSQHRQMHMKFIKPPEPQEKPRTVAVSAALKDMPPEAQAQWLEKELGLTVVPQDFVDGAKLEAAKKAPKPATGKGGQKGPPAGGPPNA